tara:strand:+ start:1535 stop:2038 length:504 start_codon:yes stop_codon:yes gene_type:complete
MLEILIRENGGEPKWVAASKLSELFMKKKRKVDSPSPPALIVQAFDKWYNLYNKKTTKKQAQKYFYQNIRGKDLFKIMKHTKSYVNQVEKRYRLDPIRYLRNEKFNDEIIFQEKKIDLDELYPFDKSGSSRLGRCSKCNSIVFGNKFTIHKDDSDCCKAKIKGYTII